MLLNIKKMVSVQKSNIVKSNIFDKSKELCFGDILRQKRKQFNITQRELGKYLGITKSQISFYEKDQSMISVQALNKLIKLYNCTMEDIITINTDTNTNNYLYLELLIEQNKKKLEFNIDNSNEIKLNTTSGLIEYDNGQEVVNFLLLEEVDENILTKYCKDNISNPNSEFSGYPLLMNLYIFLNKTSWIGKDNIWPTSGNNILALRFLDGKIVELFISNLKSGCNLTCFYSKDLEKDIGLWLQLNNDSIGKITKQFTRSIYDSHMKNKENYCDE